MQALKASALLETFTAAGLALILTPDSALKVMPASSLNDQLRAVIMANKAVLVNCLQSNTLNVTTTGQFTNPDHWCWPHSSAMNASEIDTFTARLVRFTDKGVSYDEAERLTDTLVSRDREDDEERLFLECAHRQGRGHWLCGKWLAANIAIAGLGESNANDAAVR